MFGFSPPPEGEKVSNNNSSNLLPPNKDLNPVKIDGDYDLPHGQRNFDIYSFTKEFDQVFSEKLRLTNSVAYELIETNNRAISNFKSTDEEKSDFSKILKNAEKLLANAGFDLMELFEHNYLTYDDCIQFYASL